MNKEVAGCRECPLKEWVSTRHYSEWICNHDEAINPANGHSLVIDDIKVTPDWCPLKKEPITISIEPQ